MEGGLKRGGRRSLCLICFKGLLGEVRLEGYIDYVSSSLVVSFCCFLQEVLLLVLSQVQACSFFLLFLPILLSGCTLSAAVLQFLFVVSLFHDIPEYLDTQDKTCSFFLLFLLNLLQGPHIKGILVVSFCCFIVTARPGRKYSECILVVSFCCFTTASATSGATTDVKYLQFLFVVSLILATPLLQISLNLQFLFVVS